ncbi:hypothetical protein [Paenibacillus xylanexedens]|uniref:hypothetical protein n=1 Tax=Paenibacillus xylanexedens TaxID=528191 RepID=UPI0011A0F594|nr:hypothetical protein [Paenibacillus xylanexedens]
MRKAIIKNGFLGLFLYDHEIEDGQLEVDYECLAEFDEGTEVEILREIPIGEYALSQKSYVILNPINNESITIAESFLEFVD